MRYIYLNITLNINVVYIEFYYLILQCLFNIIFISLYVY